MLPPTPVHYHTTGTNCEGDSRSKSTAVKATRDGKTPRRGRGRPLWVLDAPRRAVCAVHLLTEPGCDSRSGSSTMTSTDPPSSSTLKQVPLCFPSPAVNPCPPQRSPGPTATTRALPGPQDSTVTPPTLILEALEKTMAHSVLVSNGTACGAPPTTGKCCMSYGLSWLAITLGSPLRQAPGDRRDAPTRLGLDGVPVDLSASIWRGAVGTSLGRALCWLTTAGSGSVWGADGGGEKGESGRVGEISSDATWIIRPGWEVCSI